MKYFLLIAFALIATVTGASVKGCQKVTSCPSQNPIWALHLPNPDDCGSFCKCDWGTAHYFSCPAGLHFNRVKQVCDWPADAGCAPGPVPTQPPPPTSPPPRFCTNVACPSQNPEFALHLPNPGSCTSFCKCDWGKAYYFDCPSGLHFNRVKQVCDWPADAGCAPGPVTTTTISPPPPPPPRFCTNVACPAQNPEFALHLPNPGKCTSFCKCDWGKAYYFDCPSGLHFNKDLSVCDWPWRANCQP
ncbi:hypothetical protein B566_EDAN016045 [Ephemera danica]|nr:hypothetical protein B566_EDAN016045 [Ephemera danica]